MQLVGAANGLYMHIYMHIIIGSDWALFWASAIMLPFGVVKYAEKAFVLWRSDLGSIRSSSKKPSGRFTEPVGFRRGRQLGNERALLVAHSLFHISKGAFADYAVKDLVEGGINREVFSYGWREMCKVVEMELSLMYDILYTKAARVHTWFGYLLRVTSPLATAAALWLFWLYNKDGQRMGDVVITYILLVATFLLDLIWLLTALGSTWTYAFLNDRPRSWLHHQLLCSGRWHRFRRFVVSPTSYRLWPGSIGQYNLLHECNLLIEKKKLEMEDIVEIHRELEEALNFDPDFQEDILIWHITTDIFLLCSDQNAASCTYVKAIKALSDYMVFLVAVRPNMLPGLKLRSTYEATRGALKEIWRKKGSSSSSKISSSCTARKKELASVLREMENKPGRKQRKPRNRSLPAVAGSLLYDSSIILSDGTKLAEELLKIYKNRGVRDKLSDEIVRFLPDKKRISGTIDMQKLLELIFEAWVRLLIFESVRCSRESHAKQLSRGGELTTIVWILAEHAGILRVRS